MIASFRFLNNPIDFDECNFQNIVIENKCLFRNILLTIDNGYIEDYFTFAENFIPFSFDKNGYFISDVLNIDFSNKKLMAKVLEYFESMANTNFMLQMSNLKSNLLTLGDSLSEFDEYDFVCRQDIETLSIIKFLEFKINKEGMSEIDLFFKFVDLSVKYFKIKVFLTKNMSLYFNESELEHISEMLTLKHINLLNIDGFKSAESSNGIKYHIIDKDLCNIDS